MTLHSPFPKQRDRPAVPAKEPPLTARERRLLMAAKRGLTVILAAIDAELGKDTRE